MILDGYVCIMVLFVFWGMDIGVELGGLGRFYCYFLVFW